MLQVQKEINEIGIEKVIEKYSLNSRTHKIFPNLRLLKYDIFSPMGERVSQECRGIILDEKNNWEVVARPFDKFFNLTEEHAAKIDWDSAKVLEKLDGSLVPMWWYGGEWRFSTSGSPDASGKVQGNPFDFQTLIKNVWKELGYKYPSVIDCTFIFELITRYNKIVVDYKGQNRLVLLGVRNNKTGKEYDPSAVVNALNLNYEVVRQFDQLKTLEDTIQQVETLNGLKEEGYVVVDKFYNRVKIKAPHYVTLHRLKGEYFNRKRALELVLLGETSEVLSYFPEWKDDIELVKNKYHEFKSSILNTYEMYKNIESQKDFALAIKDAPMTSVLFAMRKGIDFEEAIRNVKLDSVYNAIGIREV